MFGEIIQLLTTMTLGLPADMFFIRPVFHETVCTGLVFLTRSIGSVYSKAIRTEEQTMAVLAQGSSFSETIGTVVFTAGLTVLTQTRMMGGVVGVERPIAVVAIIRSIEEPLERRNPVIMVLRF